MTAALLISIRFPANVYRGADLGRTEPLPSPARLHAAFVAAAAGGPDAAPDGRVLVASAADREAVCWLERSAPLGMLAPPSQVVRYSAVRHRVRVAVDPDGSHDHHRNETEFESFTAVGAPTVFAWPLPEPWIQERLRKLAAEITHVGQADSTAIVSVTEGDFDGGDPQALVLSEGRGAGQELRIPEEGRFAALVAAHADALALRAGRHRSGDKGRQASDQIVAGAGDVATALRRFAPLRAERRWPYGEVWVASVPDMPAWAVRPEHSVRTAVSVHRALVAAIGSDVPESVTGRTGADPANGAGHVAIHCVAASSGAAREMLVAVPAHVPDADRARLLDALSGSLRLRIGGKVVRVDGVELRSARAYWGTGARVFATGVPMVLDTPGTPRRAPWTLDDAVICSVGYAMRGVLEAQGLEWGGGWEFRRHLVSELRALGVDARALRVPRDAARFTHHSRPGDLLVAVHAVVSLGTLAQGGRGLLALGRSRHLGGGLLWPLA